MPRYVCVHGHFYQPPRENPWLEKVEVQESAMPWHDWNARISAECYSRNAASRILNEEGKIAKICNNYSRMSFNIGPTLLSWLEENDPLCYRAILEADALGRERFSGHGPAMAQVYNHIIMPLATRRDKETQIKWGVADFKRRFGRMPEGMWLAEAAVDTETLEVLAENGIRFTLLSPYQAGAVRPLGKRTKGEWRDVTGARVDTRCAYTCLLPSGKSISLFFYDGVLSQKIAFGGLLDNGEFFARQLIEAHEDRGQPILSHVATDGESYGHHHKHGDMALAYCLETIDKSSAAQLTVYGEFLSFYPPEFEVRIVENSSWSCAHGVERWRSDCGCSAGTPGYHQKWRGPLRKALDALRDDLCALFEKGAEGLFPRPWEARDRYIDVILDRSDGNVERWLKENAGRDLSPGERVRALSLMEMQRNALLMYTSCGWFFDEISRIEPVQILRYAARAMELAKGLCEEDLEPAFMKLLAEAPSNVPELRDGAKVYELLARQGRIDMPQLAAYYGITSLLEDFAPDFSEGCWDLSGSDQRDDPKPGDSSVFSAGAVRVRSHITGEEGVFLFAANQRGATSLLCGVSPEELIRSIAPDELDSLRALFAEGKEREMIDRFGHRLYSLRHIPADAQRRLLDDLLRQDILRIETSVRDIVRDYAQLLEYLTAIGVRPPAVITLAAQITLTFNILHNLEGDVPDLQGIRRDLDMARFWQIAPDEKRIRFAFNEALDKMLERLCEAPEDVPLMERASDLIALFREYFDWRLSLYKAQNLYYELLRRHGRALHTSKTEPAFLRLGRLLHFSDELLKN